MQVNTYLFWMPQEVPLLDIDDPAASGVPALPCKLTQQPSITEARSCREPIVQSVQSKGSLQSIQRSTSA